MSNNEWWKKPKTHEEKYHDEATKRYVREVEAAVNSIGGEKGLQIAKAVTASLAKQQDSRIAEEQKQRDFKDLKDREVDARNGVNPFGFFTGKRYDRAGPTAAERLDIKRMKEQAPPQPSSFDWKKVADAAREKYPDIQNIPDRSKDIEQDR